MEIRVIEVIKSELAIFHNEGLEVNKIITGMIKNGKPAKVNFAGLERCSTQFLNAAIGKLYLSFQPAQVDKFLDYDFGNLGNLKDRIFEVRENAINHSEHDSLVMRATA